MKNIAKSKKVLLQVHYANFRFLFDIKEFPVNELINFKLKNFKGKNKNFLINLFKKFLFQSYLPYYKRWKQHCKLGNVLRKYFYVPHLKKIKLKFY
jgi:hypothetical protein